MALTKPQEQSVIRLWRNPNLSVADMVNQLAEEFPGELTTLNRNKLIGYVNRMRQKGADVPKREQHERNQANSRAHRARLAMPVAQRKDRTPKRLRPKIAFAGAPARPGRKPKQEQKQNPVQKWSKFGNGPLSANLPGEGFEQYVADTTAGAKPLLELQPNECHWPVGDDKPQLYCGQPILVDYCAKHTRQRGRR